MASLRLINRVKYSKTIFSLYNYFGSKAISLLKLFLRNDKRLIVFASFGGRKYDDSPKAIYEAMITDARFDEYTIVWAFMHPEDFSLPRGKKVKIDTLRYFVTLLKAGAWVHNSSMTRGLNFSGINTFELNSWHGSAIKRMGSDINVGNKSFGLKKRKGQKENAGVMLAQGQYDVDVFSNAFGMSRDSICVIGLPRNDALVNVTTERQRQTKERLGIPENRKVILYAPTFREYVKDSGNNCVMVPPMKLQKWKDVLGKDYVLLFRAHYEVTKVMGIEDNEFVKNVSTYPNLNELMIASDMLVSDYSSIFFDYAIQGKPMLCFTYDYERYEKERGMYFDIRKYIPYAESEGEVIKQIKSTDMSKKSESTIAFQKKYITAFGSATKKSLDIIFCNLH